MYERIILTPSGSTFPDGSKSLPSSLVFSSLTQYQESTNYNKNIVSVNSKILNSKTKNSAIAYNTNANLAINGTLTNNTFEFIVDFPKFPDGYNKTTTIRNLLNEFENSNVAIRINKTFLNSLSCISIPDYSFQAMTMKNYDYFIKIFDNNGKKLRNTDVMVIKSYTLKKAWIFYINPNRSVSDPNNEISKVIIDFRYKNNTTFDDKHNRYSNIQDYFNILSIRSPYYDKYWFEKEQNEVNLVNKQANISFIVFEK